MLECVVDSREQSLIQDIQAINMSISVKMLPLGDVIIQKKDEEEILLMIERKSVRDLVQSLKDGRHHDQRRRWLEFLQDSPNSCVSLWIEGDLMGTEMDDTIKSSLLNSLFRMQSKHNIIIHHARTRNAFVKSLEMVFNKLEKEPYHLLSSPMENGRTNTNMRHYKKSAHSEETYWNDCLCIVPGVSPSIAQKISELFPTLRSFVQQTINDPQQTYTQLSQLKITDKRRLGEKLSQKIIQHICRL